MQLIVQKTPIHIIRSTLTKTSCQRTTTSSILLKATPGTSISILQRSTASFIFTSKPKRSFFNYRTSLLTSTSSTSMASKKEKLSQSTSQSAFILHRIFLVWAMIKMESSSQVSIAFQHSEKTCRKLLLMSSDRDTACEHTLAWRCFPIARIMCHYFRSNYFIQPQFPAPSTQTALSNSTSDST